MKKVLITLGTFALTTASHAADSKMSRSEYIQNWSETAVSQMMEYNIPASITLAQGILESGSGNSELARKGNNHFGIKCHEWDGKKMYLDDDAKNECFRVYKNAEQSYEDHSEFLKKYDRYKFLFTYDVLDYKSWANGLKKAGYATNPKYPSLLITIIEEMELYEYDRLSSPDIHYQPSIVAEKQDKQVDTNMNSHHVYQHKNKVKYVVAKKGDTFYKLSKEFGLNLKQLYKYNDFEQHKDVLVQGDVIYIQPKRRRSRFKNNEVVVEKDMTVMELSQFSAVKIKSIKRLNDFIGEDITVSKGEKVTLR